MSQGKIAFCTTITTTMFATKAVRFVPSAMRASTATKFLRTKRTTNIAGLEIHPDPLPELVSTYTHTLNVLKGLPESAVFRQSSEAVTQQRLDIVKEAMTPTSRETVYGSEAAIDRVVAAIDAGLIEEIVDQANDEFHLATKMIDWKPYVSFLPLTHPQTRTTSGARSPWSMEYVQYAGCLGRGSLELSIDLINTIRLGCVAPWFLIFDTCRSLYRRTMTRHSKQNSAQGHFTYAEYQYVRATPYL